jgi:Spy/CpxP family protein refolding chaperone
MIRPSAALLALALVATTASAQRRSSRDKDAPWDELRSQSNTGLRLSNGDVEDMDGVKRLVDKRKDLKLTDEQQKQLRDLDAKAKESNKPNFKVLDSLRQAMRPRGGMDEDAERARVSLTRENVINIVTTIRATYDAGAKEALALLDETQKAKADELLKKLAEESDETLREKLGGRPGMGGGGRRGGGPPR